MSTPRTHSIRLEIPNDDAKNGVIRALECGETYPRLPVIMALPLNTFNQISQP